MAVEHNREMSDRLLKAPKLSGVERSSTTPTMTSEPRPTRPGATCPRTAVICPSAKSRWMRRWQVAGEVFTRLAISALPSRPFFLQQPQDLHVRPVEFRSSEDFSIFPAQNDLNRGFFYKT